MIEDLVSLEQARELAKLGFDYDCLYFYDENGVLIPNGCDHKDGTVSSAYRSYNTKNNHGLGWVDAPTLYQVLKWILERHSLYIQINTTYYKRYEVFDVDLYSLDDERIVYVNAQGFPTYEETLSCGINMALDEIKFRTND